MARNSKRLVYGVGTKGDDVSRINGKTTKPYQTWGGMLERCYSKRCQKLHPTYIDCTVCATWLYFPTFKKWFGENYEDGWELDKDLLVTGNKIYSPDNCIFVPHQLNLLFNDNGRARGEFPLGVSFNKKAGKFQTYVTIDGRPQHLGLFDDPNEAHKTYLVAKRANVVRVTNVWRDKIPTKLYDALLKRAEELI